MNTLGFFLSALAAAGVVQALEPNPGPPVSSPLHVAREVLPQFPRDLQLVGINYGVVLMAVGVDTAGKVDDCLALAYSDKSFAEVALASLRQWTFDPMRVDGRAVATTTRLTFNFRTDGLVLISMGGSDVGAIFTQVIGHFHQADAFRTYELRELDAIPRPIAAPAPVYPRELLQQGRTGAVTVGFYIDPAGAVRLPSVEASEDPLLAALAIAALQTWRFEPPLRNHQPVQVRASQVFRFGPSK